jgi:HEAT repeat protein
LVRDPDWSVRQPVVKALGRLHDSRAAEPLADILARNGNMYGQDISTALINLGTPAESAVIGVLNERNYETQRLACQILQEIGTSASMDSLQKALADGDSSVSQAASDAIHAIKERM